MPMRPMVLAARDLQELPDLGDLLRHRGVRVSLDKSTAVSTRASQSKANWVPEGSLAGILWVGFGGLGGPWGL
jgi:hypothetical protein